MRGGVGVANDVTQFKFEFPHYTEKIYLYVTIGCDVGVQVTY